MSHVTMNVVLPYRRAKLFLRAIGIRTYNLLGVPIVHHEGYDAPLPEGHRFPMAKFTHVFQYLVSTRLHCPEQQTGIQTRLLFLGHSETSAY